MSCKNCGHDSHCGTVLERKEQHYILDGGQNYYIEVCRQCSCIQCINPRNRLEQQALLSADALAPE